MSGAPEATRSCDDCQRWEYRSDGSLLTRGMDRKPVPRAPGNPTPCSTCPKVPPDSPALTRAYAQELSPRNLQAYRHYLYCAAVGVFPDDPIVRRNAAIIASIIKAKDDSRIEKLIHLLGGKL